MADPDSKLRVTIVDARGRPARVPGLAPWLARAAPAKLRGDVTIALVSDARIRALNRRFRNKDQVTDVLSFPWDPGPPDRGPSDRAPRPEDLGPYLGDVAIARGLAVRQARANGHSLTTELRILALHGLLHLIGYDHEQDRGEMRRLEAQLRKKGGLNQGLIERTR